MFDSQANAWDHTYSCAVSYRLGLITPRWHLSLSTCEWVDAAGLGRAHNCSFSVLYDEVGHLVQEHGAEVVLLQEVVCREPGVLRDIVRELHGRTSFVYVNCEDKVIFLEVWNKC